MSMTLGIDIGGSTTKIVGFRENALCGTLQVSASDQITSLYGAIGSFLRKTGLSLSDVGQIILTGVGASFFDESIYGITTLKVDEFLAIGRGALHLTGLPEALVVSLGTGTAFVRASTKEILHLGGSGVGGGTIIGLASKLLGKSDFDAILALCEDGKLENVDLSVRDIIGREIPSLPPDLTASNFGKIKSTATHSDLALGIINMVFQTAGMLALFAARNDNLKNVVLTGTLTTIPQAREILAAFVKMSGMDFIIPENSVFSTAIGACLSC